MRACSTRKSSWVPSPAMVSVVPGWVLRIRGSAAIASCTPFSYSSRPKYSSSAGPPCGRRGAKGHAVGVDPVGDDRGLGQPGAEQRVDLLAHGGRTGDQRVGFVHQPGLQRMHLAAHLSGHPAGMPSGLGGVDGGNQWHIEEFGQGDGRVGDQPVVGVHQIGLPVAQRQRRTGTIEWPMASVQAIMSVPKVNSCGSCGGGDHPHALAHLVGGRVGARVGAGGAAGQHDDLVPGEHQLGGQMVHVPAEAADDHRRVLPGHHQDLHVHAPSTAHDACANCGGGAACRAADTHARGKGGHRGSRRASRAPNRPSARFQSAASRSACSRRPEASAAEISRVACACRWAR